MFSSHVSLNFMGFVIPEVIPDLITVSFCLFRKMSQKRKSSIQSHFFSLFVLLWEMSRVVCGAHLRFLALWATRLFT